MTIYVIGNDAGFASQLGYWKIWRTPCGVPCKTVAIPQYCVCTRRDGSGDEFAAIGLFPGICQERVSRHHGTAICNQIGNPRSQTVEGAKVKLRLIRLF